MRNLRFPLFLTVLLFGSGFNGALFAQEQPRYSRTLESAPARAFWGANLGVLIGTYTNIGAAPFVGYRVTPTTDAGAGPFLQYAAYRRKGYLSYGGRAFVRQSVFRNFFAQAEYEFLDTEDPDAVVLDPDPGRIQVNSLFLGPGYYGGVGGRLKVHMALLFNVLDNDFKPYRDPVIRIGFSKSF